MTPTRPPIVVMGVSAAGKSTIGEALAQRIGARFVDADDLHSDASIAKMRTGTPLDDADRLPWLERVGDALAPGTVVACSALRRAYRDVLRRRAPDAFFLHLDVDPGRLRSRASRREGHFMPPALLASQLAALEPLEPDEAGAVIDADAPSEQVVDRALAALPP